MVSVNVQQWDFVSGNCIFISRSCILVSENCSLVSRNCILVHRNAIWVAVTSDSIQFNSQDPFGGSVSVCVVADVVQKWGNQV